MKKASLLTALLILVAMSFTALTILPERARATTLYVGGTDPGNYTTIQGAIDDAVPGDTIYVYGGTYYEHILVTISLSLVGEDRNATIIDGSGNGIPLNMSSDWVNLTGFGFRNSGPGWDDPAVRLHSSNHSQVKNNSFWNNQLSIGLHSSHHNLIAHNNLSDNWEGMEIVYSSNNTIDNNNLSFNSNGIYIGPSRDNVISNNTVTGSDDGFWLGWANRTLFLNNNVSSNGRYGFVISCSNSTFRNNTVNDNGYYGIYLWGATDNTISYNNASDNHDYGIYLNSSSSNALENNTVTSNRIGVMFTSSDANLVANNRVWGNGHGIYLWALSDANTFKGNNVSSNDGWGIRIDWSNENTIVENTATSNTLGGISLSSSLDSRVELNSLIDEGIHMEGDSLSHWNTHVIETSNTVNGKPVHYWRNVTGGTVPSGAGQVILANCTGVVVENQNVSDGTIGILLGFSSGNTMSNITASSNGRHAISLYYSDSNDIVNNTALDNAQGLYLSGSTLNVIANNTLSNNGRSGINLRRSNGNSVVNNGVSESPVGIELYDSAGIVVTSNVMVSDGILVSGNDLEHWNSHAIGTSNTVNGKPVHYWKNVTGGTVPSGAGQVILANCTGVVVENQNVSRGTAGVQLAFSQNNTITNSTVTSNNHVGVYFSASHNNLLAGSNVSMNGLQGIQFNYSNGNTVIDGTVSRNGYGFRFSHSDNNRIINNTISFNSYHGIVSSSSDVNHIVNNSISHNRWGIYLLFCLNTHIYHNTLVDNTEQALDNYDNEWDNGYPSGGNYWSDYMGNDIYSGPNQDQPGSDGIGDTPYDITLGSWDRFPLMSPGGIVFPRPPSALSASLTGKGQENVTLAWALSPDDGTGFQSVVGYEILRNTTYDLKGRGYFFVASVPNGTSTFVDSLAGEGDPNDYFYRVCAVDGENHTACFNRQAGKFTRALSEGPNLVSIPLVLSDTSVEEVLQTVEFDMVAAYSAFDEDDPWKWLARFKPYGGDLRSINHTVGVWINVTRESNLTVAGVVPVFTNITLKAGWNLIGFPSLSTSFTVADLKAVAPAERLEGFDTAPPNFLRALQDSDFLLAGQGYWVKASEDTVWIVINM